MNERVHSEDGMSSASAHVFVVILNVIFWSLTEQQLKEYIGVDAFVRNR